MLKKNSILVYNVGNNWFGNYPSTGLMPPAAANEKEGSELGTLGAEPRRPRQEDCRPPAPPAQKEKNMCGRYTLTVDVKTIAETFGVAPAIEAAPRYNIAPTQEVGSILSNGSVHLDWLQWRLIRSKRSLVVADVRPEWKTDQAGKTTMYISLKSGSPFAFAGLWDLWHSPDGQEIRSCTIVTTQPNAVVASIHDRMPAILLPDAREMWLDTSLKDEHALLPLLAPYPADEMTARAVSRLVNNPKVEGAELIA